MRKIILTSILMALFYGCTVTAYDGPYPATYIAPAPVYVEPAPIYVYPRPYYYSYPSRTYIITPGRHRSEHHEGH